MTSLLDKGKAFWNGLESGERWLLGFSLFSLLAHDLSLFLAMLIIGYYLVALIKPLIK